MAVAFDATSYSGNQTVTPYSWSHTCSGSDRVLIVGVTVMDPTGNAPTVTGVTYNGVALTQIQSNGWDDAGSFYLRSYLWRLIAPATGANTVQVTLSAAPNTSIGGAVSVTGAHQTTPETGTAGTNNITGSAISTTLGSTVNDLCADCTVVWDGTGLVVDAGQTERWKESNADTVWHGGSTEPGAASVTMGWTWTNANNFACHSMVSIAQAAAAVAFVPNTSMALLGVGH